MNQTENERLNYALRYAALGWPVLPVHWIKENGKCSCNKNDCKNQGKHPLTRDGLKDASTDPAIITAWFRRWPDANIGIRTGAVSRLFVLDVDHKSGGLLTLSDLEDQHGRLPGLCAQTGGGGFHYLFRYSGPECRSKTNVYKGIDTRGDGGYILVEPSTHVSGGTYQWLDDDPLDGATVPEMPDWLRATLQTPNRPAAMKTQQPEKALPPPEIKKIRAALAYIPADDRDIWLHIGMALQATGAGNQAFGLWCEWAQQSEKFNLADSRRVWDSFEPVGGIKLGSLFEKAKEFGYLFEPSRPPVPPIEAYLPNVSTTPFRSAPLNTHNPILDTERRYWNVDLLRHLPSDHLLARLSLSVASAAHLPPSTTLLVGLGVFSGPAARRWKVEYRYGGYLPIGLYVVAEQPSGIGKGRSLSVYEGPFYALADRLRSEAAAELDQLAENIIEDEDRQAKAADTVRRLSGPLFISNATPEGLEKTLCDTAGFFSVVSSEQGLLTSLLGQLYATGGPPTNNNDIILNGYDGGRVASVRVTRQGYCGHVVGAAVCYAQEGSIERVLAASNGTGVSERFLMLAEQHLLGRRDHTREIPVNRHLIERYGDVCAFFGDVLQAPRRYEELDVLKISEEGHHLIAAHRNKIEPLLSDGADFSHISLRGAAAKINIQVMKLAANLYLSCGADSIAEVIPDAYVVSALDIADDLLRANLGLCRAKGIIGQKAEYTSILALFESDARPRTERRIITTKVKSLPFSDFSGNKSARIRETLAEMVDQGLLTRLIDGGVTTYCLAQ